MRTSEIAVSDIDVLDDYIQEGTIENKKVNEEYVKSLTQEKEKSLINTYTVKFVQRSVDILAGIIGLIVLMILTPIVFIANKVSKNDGPLFYFQERI